MMAVLASFEGDFAQWYQDVIAKAELADNGPVRGTMVIRPYGYAIWERMQAEVDQRIKATGARNAYFPLLIPESYIKREADHVEGFSPELAIVTHAGQKKLEEPAVVRPTSETVVGVSMAKWIQSHRDLPLLLNQWANVVRWELRPRLFLRTTEFLWQEGHTAHASAEDAAAYVRRIHLDVYRDFLENVLALPVFVGVKTPRERFAGAIRTLTCEAMMRDGKALQIATSHELGQNFATAFGISFLDKDQIRQTAHTTSWGSSTRMVGGLIMGHGDEKGLRIPPALAPAQVVIVAVQGVSEVIEACDRLARELGGAGVRVEVDDRFDTSFGRRVTSWELKGAPVRIEVGARDIAAGTVSLVDRNGSEKRTIPIDAAAEESRRLLEASQRSLFDRALSFQEQRTVSVSSVEEAIEAAQTGFARLPWEAVKESGETAMSSAGVSVRCLQRPDGTLPDHDSEPDLVALCARAY